MCHKTKLVSILLQEEPNVPLLVIWTKQRKVLSPDDAVKRAVKQKVLLIFYCLHCAMPTDTLLPRRLWDEPPVGLNTKCVKYTVSTQ